MGAKRVRHLANRMLEEYRITPRGNPAPLASPWSINHAPLNDVHLGSSPNNQPTPIELRCTLMGRII